MKVKNVIETIEEMAASGMKVPKVKEVTDAPGAVEGPEERAGAPDKVPYAACVVKFLDRSTGITKSMCYPITEVELYAMTPEEMDKGIMPRPVRRFVVEQQGAWTEKPVVN